MVNSDDLLDALTKVLMESVRAETTGSQLNPSVRLGSSAVGTDPLSVYDTVIIRGGGNQDEFFRKISSIPLDELGDSLGVSVQDEPQQPTPHQPSQPQPEPTTSQKFSIGERVFDRISRQTVLIVDYSTVTKQYAVRYDNGDIQWVRGDRLEPADEQSTAVSEDDSVDRDAYRSLHEKLFGEAEEEEKESPLSALESALKDPQVAPIVVEKLLEAKVITPEQAMRLLQVSGSVRQPGRREQQ